MLFSGQNEVVRKKFNNPMDELQAAKNCTYWSNSSKPQPDKRASYKGSLEVSEGKGRKTQEIELSWWPNLFTATKQGKLAVRFFIKKVSV